jgi:hypothetical protein
LRSILALAVAIYKPPASIGPAGFGSKLVGRSISGQRNGAITYSWQKVSSSH